MLREFYKELNKDKQNSAETSSNLSNTSKNVDEARYVKHTRNLSESLTTNLVLIECLCVCKQQVEEEGLRLFQG